MGKRETQFLKKIASGLGITVYESEGSGGPGRSYRKGMSQADPHKTFPDDDSARERFEYIIWPDDPVCPRCKSGDRAAPPAHKSMPYRCAKCRRHFDVGAGTVMERSKLGYCDWAEAIYHMVTNVNSTSKSDPTTSSQL